LTRTKSEAQYTQSKCPTGAESLITMELYTCDCCGSDETEINVISVTQEDVNGTVTPADNLHLCNWCNKQRAAVERVIDGPELPPLPGEDEDDEGDGD